MWTGDWEQVRSWAIGLFPRTGPEAELAPWPHAVRILLGRRPGLTTAVAELEVEDLEPADYADRLTERLAGILDGIDPSKNHATVQLVCLTLGEDDKPSELVTAPPLQRGFQRAVEEDEAEEAEEGDDPESEEEDEPEGDEPESEEDEIDDEGAAGMAALLRTGDAAGTAVDLPRLPEAGSFADPFHDVVDASGGDLSGLLVNHSFSIMWRMFQAQQVETNHQRRMNFILTERLLGIHEGHLKTASTERIAATHEAESLRMTMMQALADRQVAERKHELDLAKLHLDEANRRGDALERKIRRDQKRKVQEAEEASPVASRAAELMGKAAEIAMDKAFGGGGKGSEDEETKPKPPAKPKPGGGGGNANAKRDAQPGMKNTAPLPPKGTAGANGPGPANGSANGSTNGMASMMEVIKGLTPDQLATGLTFLPADVRRKAWRLLSEQNITGAIAMGRELAEEVERISPPDEESEEEAEAEEEEEADLLVDIDLAEVEDEEDDGEAAGEEGEE